MLARVKNFGFDPVIYFQEELLSSKLNPMQKLERYDTVGAAMDAKDYQRPEPMLS